MGVGRETRGLLGQCLSGVAWSAEDENAAEPHILIVLARKEAQICYGTILAGRPAVERSGYFTFYCCNLGEGHRFLSPGL